MQTELTNLLYLQLFFLGLLCLILGFIAFIILKQLKLLPTQIRLSAAGYRSGANKKTKKVEAAFYKDVSNLIINSNPEMFEKFPLSMQQIQDNPDLGVPFATLVTRHAAPVIIDTIFNQLGMESEAVRGITKEVAGSETVIKNVFDALGFGKKKNKDKDKDDKEEPVSKRRNAI